MPSSVLSWIQSIHKKGANKIEKENLMPYIPIPYPQQQQGIPMPQVSAPQAPTVNLTGVMAGVGAVADASRQRMIPVEPFLAPGQGMQQIGRAIMPLAQLAAHYAEAKDDVAAATAQSQLAVEFEKFRATMPKTDPDTWERSFDEFAGQALERVMANENLSPGARQRIKLYGDKWQFNAKANIMRDATVEMGQRAESALFANVANARRTGNFDAADAMLDTVEADVREGRKAYVDPRNIESERARNAAAREAKQKDDAFNANFDEIQRDPDGWKSRNPERPADMDAAVYDRLRSEADSVIYNDVKSIGDRMTNAVVTGEIKVPSEVDNWEKDNPRITPSMRESVRNLVIRRNDATAREAMLARAPEVASQLRSEAKAFDPKRNTYEQYIALRMRIAELPAGIEGDVSQILERKNPDRIADIKPSNKLLALGEDLLDSYLAEGAFGSFSNGTGKDSKGNPVINPGQPGNGEVYVVDEAQKRAALTKKAAIGGKLKRWLDANPNATEDDVQKKVGEFLPEGTRQSILDMMDRGNKTTAGTGDVLDLPGGGGGAMAGSSILPSPDSAPPEQSQAVWVADKNKSMEVIPMTAADIERWKSAGDGENEVWDSKASKFVRLKASKLIPGQHYMSTSLIPQ